MASNLCGHTAKVDSSDSVHSATEGAGSLASAGSERPVSATDQCARRRMPLVGSTPRPYCGNATGMPPLQSRSVMVVSCALPSVLLAASECYPLLKQGVVPGVFKPCLVFKFKHGGGCRAKTGRALDWRHAVEGVAGPQEQDLGAVLFAPGGDVGAMQIHLQLAAVGVVQVHCSQVKAPLGNSAWILR